MQLNKESTNRSYLFGRLLAVYDRIEKVACSSSESGRETNALRYQTAFMQYPAATWRTLETLSAPYMAKLKTGSLEYFRKTISEITSLFSEEDAPIMNRPLDENYLLGFYLQRNDFYTKKKDDGTTDGNADEPQTSDDVDAA